MSAGGASVSVVMVTWNSAAVIEGAIRSLQDTVPPIEWELIVVDNASSDDTVARVRTLAPGATVIGNDTNRGLAAGNNQGLSRAAAAAILICNPDVIFRPGAVSALLGTMGRHPRAAWVVPRLLYENGGLQTSAGALPTLREALLGRILLRERATGEHRGMWWDGWAHDREQVIGRGHEAAYLIRREAVDDVGPQDERYVLDWEGVDWTDRFQRAGWEIWLAPEANVVHLGGASIRQAPLRAVALSHLGMYHYFADRMPRARRPALAVAVAARAAMKAAATSVGFPIYQWAHHGLSKRRVGRASSQSSPDTRLDLQNNPESGA